MIIQPNPTSNPVPSEREAPGLLWKLVNGR
jgi:hypothetical protein